jgi:hypothetical protein
LLLVIPVVLAKAGLLWLLQQADGDLVIPALLWALRQPAIGYAVSAVGYLGLLITVNAWRQRRLRLEERRVRHEAEIRAAAVARGEICPDGNPHMFMTVNHLSWNWCERCGTRTAKTRRRK